MPITLVLFFFLDHFWSRLNYPDQPASFLDITRSMQHKQEQGVKSQKQHDLLAGLGALSSLEDNVSVPPDAKNETSSSAPMADSYPLLPLWRRVDKQFWWNEWMSRPFIDAGVCYFFFQSTRLFLFFFLLN